MRPLRRINNASVALESDSMEYRNPALAVDAAVRRGDEVLLIQRGNEPWKGALSASSISSKPTVIQSEPMMPQMPDFGPSNWS